LKNGNGNPHGIEVEDKSSSPGNELERKEREAMIQRAIASLPKDQRTVVVLRDIEGLSYDEVARITACTPGTVKSKLARARMKLKEKLKGLI